MSTAGAGGEGISLVEPGSNLVPLGFPPGLGLLTGPTQGDFVVGGCFFVVFRWSAVFLNSALFGFGVL